MNLTVFGEPIPKGSTRAFVVNGVAVTTNANPKTKDWERLIKGELQVARPGDIITGPVDVTLQFYMTRGKSVKRPYPITKPDIDKLCRAAIDAMTGIVFKDDSQVIGLQAIKRYADGQGDFGRARVEIIIQEVR